MGSRRKSKQARALGSRSPAQRQPARPQQSPAAAPIRHGPRAQAAAGPAAAETPRAPRPRLEELLTWKSTPLSRDDLVWAGAAAAISAILFATTLYGHAGLGDAPESVAGIASTGVLHAPGYPAYVIAAKLFTALVPFGSFAFQVNLFSLCCAALTIGGVYLLGRRLGAERWASALGALALACGGGFWFYAGFAKHVVFSGLLFLVALHLLLAWQARPSTGRFVALAAAIGVGMGSSWALMTFILPAVGLALLLSYRQLSPGMIAGGVAAGLATVVALYGFVMVRASQDPAVNWGEVTTLDRLRDLVNRADFKPPTSDDSNSPASEAEGSASNLPQKGPILSASFIAQEGSLTRASKSSKTYLEVFYHELGLAALALAAWGLVVSLLWRRGPPAFILLLVFAANLIGAGATVGPSVYRGFDTLIIQEGFILACYLVLPVWLAIGATHIGHVLAESGSPRDRDARRAEVKWGLPAVLALAVLLPSLISHWEIPRRNAAPFADNYAESAFAELPRDSVVLIFGAERTGPLINRQVVDGDRPDVTVVASDGLSREWYREQLARRTGVDLPPPTLDNVADTVSAVGALRRTRPVFMDITTAQRLSDDVGYRQVGLLTRLVDGKGPAELADPSGAESRLRQAEQSAGMPDEDWGARPNTFVFMAYKSATLELARAYFLNRDEAGLRRTLRNTLAIDPGNEQARQNLRTLNIAGLPRG